MLNDEIRALIRDHKAELLEALQSVGAAEDLRDHFEERAGILEYDAGLPRPEAELEAAGMQCPVHVGSAANGAIGLPRASGISTRRCCRRSTAAGKRT